MDTTIEAETLQDAPQRKRRWVPPVEPVRMSVTGFCNTPDAFLCVSVAGELRRTLRWELLDKLRLSIQRGPGGGVCSFHLRRTGNADQDGRAVRGVKYGGWDGRGTVTFRLPEDLRQLRVASHVPNHRWDTANGGELVLLLEGGTDAAR